MHQDKITHKESSSWISTVLQHYQKQRETRHRDNNNLLIKSRSYQALSVDKDYTKITLKDFIPPIFIKLIELIKAAFSRTGLNNVTHITYIELGVVSVFLGTLAAFFMIIFNVPVVSADLAYVTQIYIDQDRVSKLTPETVAKANQTKMFLGEYRSGVVLGVSGTISGEDEIKDQAGTKGVIEQGSIFDSEAIKQVPAINSAPIPADLDIQSVK